MSTFPADAAGPLEIRLVLHSTDPAFDCSCTAAPPLEGEGWFKFRREERKKREEREKREEEGGLL